MQDINNDMDDMLRRAAEAYPLKAADRWEDVKAGLLPETGQVKHGIAVFLSRQGYFFILLFSSFMAAHLWIYDQQNHQPKPPPVFTAKTAGVLVAEENIPGMGSFTKKNQVVQLPHNRNYKSYPGAAHLVKTRALTQERQFYPQEDKIATPVLDLKKYNRYQPLAGPYAPIRETRWPAIIPARRLTINETRITQALHDELQVNAKDPRKKIALPKGFYYGFTAGLHTSAIKKGSFQKPATDGGLLTGFRFSNRISVETGVLLSSKNYETQGENFNMDIMQSSLPSGMKITYVKGAAKMIEIPVHLRYDVIVKEKHRVYSTAGVSSNLLHKEENDYSTMVNGSEGKMKGSYGSVHRYLAATADFSLGYEMNIHSKNNFRIEPYVQLPLRGMGVGLINVKSTGLRVTLTRSFH